MSGEVRQVIRLAPKYTSNGVSKSTNIPGFYRECEDEKCSNFVPCPYVRCQEHRTDMAIKDHKIQHLKPDEVKIVEN